ncbi:MAG: diguanylate cyclase [Zoogloeaceae bacterium]|jgi:diguanylate cyclase (GGDEF)-like protein|nr:diguanylate cyclase [Zoogloeaceae bacterium]
MKTENPTKRYGMEFWLRLSVKTRLILLFIAIKVVPLMLLVSVAWYQTQRTSDNLGRNMDRLIDTADSAISNVGKIAILDSVEALDARAREEIERQSTDTARRVAAFLYGRDADIRYAASLSADVSAYRNFIESKRGNLVTHGAWRLNAAQTDWEPVETPAVETFVAEPGSKDNATHFHYRPPTVFKTESSPLYLAMSFIGLDGREQIRVTTTDRIRATPADITRRENTYAQAENYFDELKRLKPGEIYVSEVIGSYVGTPIIGKFTPDAAQARGIAFEPEKYAYAGKENPVGKRFQGIVRWATPVVRNGVKVGYVSLALDHAHLMSFTDTIVPTGERYRDINDAFDGNYAFIWDYKGKSIVHPRHHSIVGYTADGMPEVPWLEDQVYDEWQKSGQSWAVFRETAPTFVDQLQSRKPANPLTATGKVGLDCRWLNFAPQCTGWYNLAREGGSGSFLILWSGLWKLTTTAAIPYFTGRYSPEVTGNRIGFGIVTIGANVADFHRAANDSRQRLDRLIAENHREMRDEGKAARDLLHRDMTSTITSLSLSTLVLIAIVVAIAIWMATFLSRQIQWLNHGYQRFRMGEKDYRFHYVYKNEITSLAESFNAMADAINHNIEHLEQEIAVRTRTEAELRDIQSNLEQRVAERTRELSETNQRLSVEVQTRRTAEEKAQYLAGHDPLTGLANRMLFNEQLQKAMSYSERSGRFGALLFFDLDKFKQFNDTLGHHVGDALLQHMARILQESIRKTDTAARLGGDEFAAIMSEIATPDDAAILAQRVLDALAAPAALCGHELSIRSSIGIATFQGEDNGTTEEIIRKADMAMYLAKTEGGQRYQFFDVGVQDKLHTSSQQVREIQQGVVEKRFIPFFRPFWSAAQPRTVPYLEVQMRWQHPNLGILRPRAFFRALAHSGVRLEIDHLIFNAACKAAGHWLTTGIFNGRLVLNVPYQYLKQPNFVADAQTAFVQHLITPQHLTFEISGFASLEGSVQASQTLRALRAMGVEIVIDQRETKHSVLRSFLEYPIDAIKINGARLNDEPEAHALLDTVIAIARARGLSLIVLGMEQKVQRAYFEKLECCILESYGQVEPMNAADSETWLRERLSSIRPD